MQTSLTSYCAEWPFGKYTPYECSSAENPNCQNRFMVTWKGRIHLAALPSTVKRLSFLIVSDASEIQFGRISKNQIRDRWIARPPVLPGVKCFPLNLTGSDDPLDHVPCPEECQPVGFKQADASHRVSNQDSTPVLWLGDEKPSTGCDRWVGNEEYLDFELNYTSKGVWPHIELKWQGDDGLPFQTVDSAYFYAPESMTIIDHFKAFDTTAQTDTVVAVCVMLALLWFVGEVLFITKKARDAEIAEDEKAQIQKINEGKQRSYDQDTPEGILMATRPVDDYGRDWPRTVSKWKTRLKKHAEANATAGFLRGCLMYLAFFFVGNAVVAFFLLMAPPAPSAAETHNAMLSMCAPLPNIKCLISQSHMPPNLTCSHEHMPDLTCPW